MTAKKTESKPGPIVKAPKPEIKEPYQFFTVGNTRKEQLQPMMTAAYLKGYRVVASIPNSNNVTIIMELSQLEQNLQDNRLMGPKK